MSIQSISIWKFHMDFPYPYGLWIESLVVLTESVAGARAGNADTRETVVLVVPIIEGMAGPAVR